MYRPPTGSRSRHANLSCRRLSLHRRSSRRARATWTTHDRYRSKVDSLCGSEFRPNIRRISCASSTIASNSSGSGTPTPIESSLPSTSQIATIARPGSPSGLPPVIRLGNPAAIVCRTSVCSRSARRARNSLTDFSTFSPHQTSNLAVRYMSRIRLWLTITHRRNS